MGGVKPLEFGLAVSFLAQLQGLDQEGNVVSQVADGGDALLILLCVTGSPAMDHVPVVTGSHWHTGDGEELVQLVKGSGAAATACYHDAGTHLQTFVKMCGVEQTLEECHKSGICGSVRRFCTFRN